MKKYQSLIFLISLIILVGIFTFLGIYYLPNIIGKSDKLDYNPNKEKLILTLTTEPTTIEYIGYLGNGFSLEGYTDSIHFSLRVDGKVKFKSNEERNIIYRDTTGEIIMAYADIETVKNKVRKEVEDSVINFLIKKYRK